MVARIDGYKFIDKYGNIVTNDEDIKHNPNLNNYRRKLDNFLTKAKKHHENRKADNENKKEKDMVNHPLHYTKGKIEVVDFIEDQNTTYFIGNVIKYCCRYRYKGNPVQDLKKARFYLDREIKRLETQTRGDEK